MNHTKEKKKKKKKQKVEQVIGKVAMTTTHVPSSYTAPPYTYMSALVVQCILIVSNLRSEVKYLFY